MPRTRPPHSARAGKRVSRLRPARALTAGADDGWHWVQRGVGRVAVLQPPHVPAWQAPAHAAHAPHQRPRPLAAAPRARAPGPPDCRHTAWRRGRSAWIGCGSPPRPCPGCAGSRPTTWARCRGATRSGSTAAACPPRPRASISPGGRPHKRRLAQRPSYTMCLAHRFGLHPSTAPSDRTCSTSSSFAGSAKLFSPRAL